MGIAYKKRSGDEIDDSLVSQIFVLMPDSKLQKQLEQLLIDIPVEYVELANDIGYLWKESILKKR